MKKPFKVAAWSGLLSFVISILMVLYLFTYKDAASGSIISLSGSLAGGILGILFMYGFVVLGKKFGGKLLLVMAWIGIAFAIVSLIFGLVTNIVTMSQGVGAQTDIDPDLADLALPLLIAFLVIWIGVTLIAGTFSVLFGIGLLKLRDKVQYARVSGILEIVAGATYIILIGFLVRLVATVFEIALLFKASEKFEK